MTLKEAGHVSRPETVLLHQAQLEWTCGKRMPSVTRTKDSSNLCYHGGSCIWGWKGYNYKQRQLQVHLKRAQQVGTKLSDADQPKAKEWLEYQIHQVTHAKGKLFNELFQHCKQLLLQQLATRETGPRRNLAITFAPIMTIAAKVIYRVATIILGEQVEFQVHRSNSETKVTTWIVSDTHCIETQLDREINSITSNGQMQLGKEFSMGLFKLEAWRETFCDQMFCKIAN